jgi:hypothetical protein
MVAFRVPVVRASDSGTSSVERVSQYVALHLKRNRGWPWPEDSWGLSPMYGEDGWCTSCGVPSRRQSGDLVLQRKGLDGAGAWVPNWQFDAICLSQPLAETVRTGFDVELRRVDWRGHAGRPIFQIVVPSIGTEWFDAAELRSAAVLVHGVDGVRCGACGVWRWMPLASDTLPPRKIDLDAATGVGVAASPEWFGDGMLAFRELRVRRDLAELLVEVSPRDFSLA